MSGVPGRSEVLTSPDEVTSFGEEFGWPVAIKAAFGGGGRGMKVVSAPAESAEALESAMRESLAYFGRDECYVERYLAWPRHVEMQVIADTHGTTLWLGERDCSAQRRHQKLVEESPAPDFPDDVRQAMGAASVKVAEACGYVNAGTVEFLYQDGEFFFLEMNTRLQVEHPVTELVTGLDLVEWQLRVASGEPARVLPGRGATQRPRHRGADQRREPRRRGLHPFARHHHGVRAARRPGGAPRRRLRLGRHGEPVLRQPAGQTGRVGPDRESARRRMLRAIDETVVSGVATTLPADVAILSHPDFISASHSTRWVEQTLDLSGVTAAARSAPATEDGDEVARVLREVTAEVDGRRYQVKLWVPDTGDAVIAVGAGPARARPEAPERRRRPGPARGRSPCPCRAPSSRSSWPRATRSRSARPSACWRR